ncbi:MAG: hypothetical protein RL514_3942 [Verrucomicrobiota bacterium]|jgi:hypothetical protein
MARKLTQEINWKPRRQRSLEAPARTTHLQMSLPFIASEVLAGDESRVELVASEPDGPAKDSESAVLHWAPRGEGRSD